MRRCFSVMLALMVTAGSAFAQDVGRIDWSARTRTDLLFNFTPKDDGEDWPGLAFDEDFGGGAYGWNTNGELLLWYGKGLVSMWTILTYRVGYGLETTLNLEYDGNKTGNAGGKIQTGQKGTNGQAGGGVDITVLNRLQMYGWWQDWDKHLLLEVNPFGALEDAWDSVWKTPAYLFDDFDAASHTGLAHGEAAYFDDNQDVFFRAQFKDLVDGLSFGLGLPNFGSLNKFQWGYYTREDGTYWEPVDVLLRANLGVKYQSFDWTVAGGFKMDPNRAHRAYAGGEYKILDGRLGLRMDVKGVNLGDFENDKGDIDIGEGLQYTDGPLVLNLTVYERNLMYNENKDMELGADVWGRYTIIPRKLMAKLQVKGTLGLGENNDEHYKVEILPRLYWAMGPQNVSDDLGNYSGVYAGLDYWLGQEADGETDIKRVAVRFGFRWCP